MKYRVAGKDSLSKMQLTAFLQAIDNRFSPTISELHPSAAQYADKIMQKGEVTAALIGDEIIGAMIFYCNDLDYRHAYWVVGAVKHGFDNQGIMSAIIEEALSVCRQKGMRCVCLYSNNPIAIQMYERRGFEKLSDADENGRFYLEMKL